MKAKWPMTNIPDQTMQHNSTIREELARHLAAFDYEGDLWDSFSDELRDQYRGDAESLLASPVIARIQFEAWREGWDRAQYAVGDPGEDVNPYERFGETATVAPSPNTKQTLFGGPGDDAMTLRKRHEPVSLDYVDIANRLQDRLGVGVNPSTIRELIPSPVTPTEEQIAETIDAQLDMPLSSRLVLARAVLALLPGEPREAVEAKARAEALRDAAAEARREVPDLDRARTRWSRENAVSDWLLDLAAKEADRGE